MGQKSKGHHNSSLSLLKNNLNEFDGEFKNKGKAKKEEKIKHKQSMDLVETEEGKKKKLDFLQPIQENKFKKKKQKDAYIYFKENEPTTLRLRFKYYP